MKLRTSRRFPKREPQLARRHGTSWRPVVLLWRQRRKRIAGATIGHTTHASNITTFHHQHFHSAIVAGERVLRERVSSFLTTAIARHTREVLHYERGGLRSTILRTQPGRIDRRVIHETRTTFNTVNTPALRSSPRPASIIARQAPSVSRNAVAHSAEAVHVQRVREERTIATRAHTQFRSQWLQMVPRRTQTVADSVTRIAHHNKTTFDRTEELVWRLQRIAETGAQEQEQPRVAMPRATSRNAQMQASEATTVQRSVVPQIAKLDPALMDRLAEDVIRRVEKRIRIERERRGL